MELDMSKKRQQILKKVLVNHLDSLLGMKVLTEESMEEIDTCVGMLLEIDGADSIKGLPDFVSIAR